MKQHRYPDDDELVSLIGQHGSTAAVARILGVPASTLKQHIMRRGLSDRVRDARLNTVEVPDSITDLALLEQRNRELEARARAALDEEVRDERWLRRLEQVVPTITPQYKPPVFRRKATLVGHEMALLFSDTHAGEVVSPEETLGMNQYDWTIMLKRMARLQEAVVSYQQHRPYPVTKLHVWMLGDMLSGSIHDELAVTNELADAEAVVQFASDTAVWLDGFAEHFPGTISVCGVAGNHPRRSKKPGAKRAHNNDDWLTYQMMRMYHRQNERFEWNVPTGSFATTDVCGRWRTLLMHGDGVRSTMPGVPWGGITRRVTTLEQQFAKAKQPLDYVALGHFHTANALDGVGVKTFMNGSVKGLDEYSLKQFGSGRPPSQLLLTFHPENGITDVSYVDLEPVRPAAEAA